MKRIPIVGAVAVATLVMGFSWRYGIFRDELYYLACARRLAWGYVDHPPLSIALLRLFGDNLVAIKIPGALAAALTVWLIGREAARRGADAWETAVTVIAVVLCPLFLAIAGIYSMNVLELAWWAIAMSISARLLTEPAAARWLALGVVIGLGGLTKYSMFMFAAGFCAGVLLTGQWRQFLTPWPWLAGIVAAGIFAPHLVWEARHGWPSLEFMHNATAVKMTAIGPLDFLKEQVLVTNPVIAICWIAGLAALLANRRLRPWRAHGIAFLVSMLILIVSGKSRAAYMAPSYTLVFPAAGIGLGAVIRRPAPRLVAMVLVVVSGVATIPFALPVLPVDTLIAYQRLTGFTPRAEEHSRLGPLPQFMADRFGWREMADAVERAYRTLPPGEPARTYVFARNYGEAGAIEYFVPSLRGRVLSGHNNYHLWFPEGWDGQEILVIGDRPDDVHKAFRDVRALGQTGSSPYSMPYEQNLPLLLGTQPIQTLGDLTRAIKHYD